MIHVTTNDYGCHGWLYWDFEFIVVMIVGGWKWLIVNAKEACIIFLVTQIQNRWWMSLGSSLSPHSLSHPFLQRSGSSYMTLAPNVNDSESQQLNGLASTTGIKKCVDFVSDLPWEIVRTYIMPRILGGTSRSPVHRLERSCGYLDVCSNWAKRIIAAYDSNYFILDVGDTLSDDCCMRIRMLVPYIESLSLRDLGARHIPQFLKCQTLVSLTRLRIKGNHHL